MKREKRKMMIFPTSLVMMNLMNHQIREMKIVRLRGSPGKDGDIVMVLPGNSVSGDRQIEFTIVFHNIVFNE